MPRPRMRLILPSTSTPTTTKTSTIPIQPTLLTHHTTPPSPLHPLSPLRPLKSPAFFHPTSAHDYNHNHPLSPLPSPCHLHRHPVPPPQSPLAWTWRCHLCRTTYRLGITRRCLEDGHYFCSTPPPPSAPSPPPRPASLSARASSSPASSETVPPLLLAQRGAYHAGEPAAERKGKGKGAARRKGRRRRVPESCTSAFDYLGWADWNAWRREAGPAVGALGLMGSSKGELGSGNQEGFVGKYQKDCFLDCDFPSECSWQRTSAYLESVVEAESPVVPF